MDCIILSSFVPTIHKIDIARAYLDAILLHFSKDSDILVAINPGSVQQWTTVLDSYVARYKNITIISVDKNFDTKSDAAGFQQALAQIKRQNKKYKFVRFAHTKGTTQNRSKMMEDMISNFLGRRKEITSKMKSNHLGGYGRYITVGIQSSNIDKVLDLIYPFPFASRNIYFLYTFYVIDGSIIDTFIHGCDGSFFQENLLTIPGGHRYFFEGTFPVIIHKFGYTVGYDLIGYNPFWNIVLKREVDLYVHSPIEKHMFIKKVIFYRMIIIHTLMKLLLHINKILPSKVIIKSKKILYKLHLLQNDFE